MPPTLRVTGLSHSRPGMSGVHKRDFMSSLLRYLADKQQPPTADFSLSRENEKGREDEGGNETNESKEKVEWTKNIRLLVVLFSPVYCQ